MANNPKICPFIKQVCAKGLCEIFNETLNRCNISVLPYNIYRLSEALKSYSGNPDGQSLPMFGNKLDAGQQPTGLGA
jgi:hypothetical protein